jgi:hypothetical protein
MMRTDGRSRRPPRRSARTRSTLASGHAGENDRANIRERDAPFTLFEAHRSAWYEAGFFDGGEDLG